MYYQEAIYVKDYSVMKIKREKLKLYSTSYIRIHKFQSKQTTASLSGLH